MDTSAIWPLWFQQLAVHQDYFWFLVLLGWGFVAVFWWWHPARSGTWVWLPWVAGGCVLGAAVQFGIFNPPFDFFHSRLIPGTTSNYAPALIEVELLGDWLTALLFAGVVAGWGWIAARGPVWRWVPLFAAGGAMTLHVAHPEIGGTALALGTLVVGFVWLARAPGPVAQRAIVVAAAMLPALSTIGPLAGFLGLLQRSGPPTPMGLLAALYQAGVAFALLMLLARGALAGGRTADGAGRWFGGRRLAVIAAVWLVGGLAFAHQTGADNRHELQQHRLRLAAARASLLNPEVLQALDLPPLQLGQLEQTQDATMLRVPEAAAHRAREVSQVLYREWRAAPYVDGVRLILLEDDWLLAVAGSQPFAVPGTVQVLRRATAQDRALWAAAANVIEHSPVAEIDQPYFCRAAVRSADGRMLGWLEFEQREFFQSIARKWRSGPLLITALGLVLGATLLFQRRAAREREAALRAAAVHAEANRMKSEFLAKVSHELRTPLQSLLGYSELLRARVEHEPQSAAWLDAVRQHGELMTRLVNDLIDLGAVEAGTLRLVPRVVAPATLVRQTVEGLRLRAEAKGLRLSCVVAPGVPEALLLDGERLRQVVFNLAGNAVKFTEQGEVVVTLHCDEPAAHGDVRLTIEVRDTGPGIAAEDRARLFTAFSRLESTVQHEGAGVGLALSAALCRAMGGAISVESERGRGAVFRAGVRATIAEAKVVSNATPPMTANLSGRRVLVVDDNTLVRELFRTVLTAAGAECVLTASASAATRAAQVQPFHVAVVDLALPDGNGLDLTRRLKAMQPRLRVVGASAHAGDAEREQAGAAGMDDFVVKPVSPADLVAAVAGLRHADAPSRAVVLPACERELAAAFRAEVKERRAALARAMGAGDLAAARATAHYLANSAAVVRDAALLDACNALVEAIERREMNTVAEHAAACDRLLASWEEAA